MAFQQPQRPQPRHAISYQTTAASSPALVSAALPSPQRTDDTEWILFSPASQAGTVTLTNSSARTQTAGRSRLSDFGSLDTAAASEKAADDDNVTAHDDDETEDLDSLDDGLHAFNEPLGYVSTRRTDEADIVLPSHDGLGSFPGSSTVQEQIWQHERYNPRRRRQSLRRSSVQNRLDALEEEQEYAPNKQDEKTQMIERWRTEQSRAILEEIEKETRRRRRRSRYGNPARRSVSQLTTESQFESTPSSTSVLPEALSTQSQIEAVQSLMEDAASENQSFWQRFTRRVLSGLMGIDDATLSFIFGEALPPSADAPEPASASQLIDHAERTVSDDAGTSRTDSWEERLLARIAKELGGLVHQLSEHPGAFSAYLRTQEQTPYAGLPTPPALADQVAPVPQRSTSPPESQAATLSSPAFTPTLTPRQTQQSTSAAEASLWGIDEEGDSSSPLEPTRTLDAKAENAAAQRERDCEYWEKELDYKMVFGYIKERLGRGDSDSDSPNQDGTSRQFSHHPTLHTSTNHADSLRRAALIRHHHPLVRRNAHAAAAAASAAALRSPALSPILGRRPSSDNHSSCASHSTKKSKTGHSGSVSSRNYWDIGVGAGGSVGSWGEV